MQTTSTVTRFDVRPIGPADRRGLERFYARLSRESLESRFHGCAPAIEGPAAAFFCGPDHGRREGFVAVAVTPDGRHEVIGHVSVEPARPGTAEIAIAVADAWQRHGIGRALVRAAIEWARRHGFSHLVATMRTTNGAIAGLVRSAGVPVSYGAPDGGVVDAVMDLEVALPLAA